MAVYSASQGEPGGSRCAVYPATFCVRFILGTIDFAQDSACNLGTCPGTCTWPSCDASKVCFPANYRVPFIRVVYCCALVGCCAYTPC